MRVVVIVHASSGCDIFEAKKRFLRKKTSNLPLWIFLRSRYSVRYWVSCAINKGGFFEIAFFVVVANSLCPRRSSFKGLLRSDILSS